MVTTPKHCRKCNQIKEVGQFHKNRNGKDGLSAYCKDCQNAMVRECSRRQRATRPKFERQFMAAGTRFGRMTITRTLGINQNRKMVYELLCDCGNLTTGLSGPLTSGGKRSCGCLVITHGQRNTRAYSAWVGLRQRCNNPRNAAWENYGGRGIRHCEKWETFEGFLDDMGHPPEGSSLDRIDHDGNYEKSNCRWSDIQTQNENRRGVTMLTYNGETRSLNAWAKIVGIDRKTLKTRIDHGILLAELLGGSQ